MKKMTIFSEKNLAELPSATTIGIDIGSRQAKAVLLHKNEIYTTIEPTGFFMNEVANGLLEDLFAQSGLTIEDIAYIGVTGYGRVAVTFEKTPFQIITEISCHGLGAHLLGDNIHTIIDIGGQDSKAIRIDPETGNVLEFIMNDKCAAGTGRFLEKMANVLGYDVEQIGEVSLRSEAPSRVSSQCVVFAESEVVSQRAKGEKAENLLAGIHLSVAKRVNHLLNRVGIEPGVLFTGGVSNNTGMRKAFEDILGFQIETSKLDTVYAGALGAAVFAGRYAQQMEQKSVGSENRFELDLTEYNNKLELAKEQYIQKTTGKKKNVAYLCSYTPVEIFGSADVAAIRLFHEGTPNEVASGEMITQSVFCDLTKSCIGGFIEKNPMHLAVEKMYFFYTCDCMKKAVEAINENFVPAEIYNLPRVSDRERSHEYFAKELRSFAKNLGEFAGCEITDEKIREQIRMYNQAKQLYRKISAYRKRDYPLLASSAFRRLALGYYYLPVNVLLEQLQKVERQLQQASSKEEGEKPIRLMVSGGILADGDNKLISIAEKLGAAIVIEDNCSGYNPFSEDIPENGEDVYRDLADGYYGKAPCARMKPLSRRVRHSVSLAEEYHVDGVLFYYLKFCPCYGISKNEYVKTFQELDIPVMEIAGDYSRNDDGQLLTRVEAFLEIIKERKQHE